MTLTEGLGHSEDAVIRTLSTGSSGSRNWSGVGSLQLDSVAENGTEECSGFTVNGHLNHTANAVSSHNESPAPPSVSRAPVASSGPDGGAPQSMPPLLNTI